MHDEQDIVEEMLALDRRLTPAAEDFRRGLNEVIARWQLNGEEVLVLLSRLTAGYVTQIQKSYDQAGADVVVEEYFQTMLLAYFTNYDMERVSAEVEKIKNEKLN